ncbi:MAG: energy transducer TonB [Lentisphaerae bacterium]|nr:energy transducer TonB [Lentisphaerota bacterium]
MKPSDILLSAMLHAGIVAGVMYGLSQHQGIPESDTEIEPMFFEILEESIIASASQLQPKAIELEPTESTPTEPTPIESKSTPEEETTEIENTVRTKSQDFILSDDGLDEVIPEEDGFSDDENMVRTEFLQVEENESAIQESDGNSMENLEKVNKIEVSEIRSIDKAVNSNELYENMVQEQDCEDAADVQQAKIVSAPMALNRIVPVYPRSARRRGREGVVTLEILVSGTGLVSKTDVVGSSGHSDLDAAAVSAVRTARFVPAIEDGAQVEGKLRLTFEFRLK